MELGKTQDMEILELAYAVFGYSIQSCCKLSNILMNSSCASFISRVSIIHALFFISVILIIALVLFKYVSSSGKIEEIEGSLVVSIDSPEDWNDAIDSSKVFRL